MELLSLRLFGDVKLLCGPAREIALPRKTQLLLAYLALNAGQSHPRDKLAALLWHDRPEEQARHSLRQCLFTLDKSLGDGETPLILADRSANWSNKCHDMPEFGPKCRLNHLS